MKNQGTLIVLHLKEQYKNLEIDSILSKYIRHIKIPIYKSGQRKNSPILLADVNKEKEVMINQLISSSEFLRMSTDETKYDFQDFKIQAPGIKGLIAIAGKLDSSGRWLPESLPTKFSTNLSFGKLSGPITIPEVRDFSFLSVEGIFINNFSFIPTWFKHNQVYSDFDLTAGKVDLALSRNNLQINEKIMDLSVIIEEKLLEGIRKLFKKIERSDQNTKYKIHFINEFILSNIRATFMDSEGVSKLIKDYYKYRCIQDNNESLLKYDVIRGQDKQIVYVFMNGNEEHIIKSMLQHKSFGKDKIYVISSGTELILLNFFQENQSYLHDLINITEHDDFNEIFLELEKSLQSPSSFVAFSHERSVLIKLCKFNNFQSDYLYEEFYKKESASLEQEKVIYFNYDHKLIRLFREIINQIRPEVKESITKFIIQLIKKELYQPPVNLREILEQIKLTKDIDVEDYMSTLKGITPSSPYLF